MELVLDVEGLESFEQIIVEGVLQKRGNTRRGISGAFRAG
jgi:hypothetical protein